jgi:hypothetical protein
LRWWLSNNSNNFTNAREVATTGLTNQPESMRALTSAAVAVFTFFAPFGAPPFFGGMLFYF